MGGHFSHTEDAEAIRFLQPTRILRSGSVQVTALLAQPWAMPALPESSDEIEQRRLQQLAEQRTMLEHLPKWIRLRGLRQKDVAAALGVSEATISGWIKGVHGMSVGQLRQIAVLLKAEPGDLLRPPEDAGLGPRVEETLHLMDQLSEPEWDAIMQNARLLAEAKRRN